MCLICKYKHTLDLNYYCESKKMTENYSPELVNALKDIVNDCNWKNVGEISSYKEMKCYRFLLELNILIFHLLEN
jgi:hypothetical protein